MNYKDLGVALSRVAGPWTQRPEPWADGRWYRFAFAGIAGSQVPAASLSRGVFPSDLGAAQEAEDAKLRAAGWTLVDDPDEQIEWLP